MWLKPRSSQVCGIAWSIRDSGARWSSKRASAVVPDAIHPFGMRAIPWFRFAGSVSVELGVACGDPGVAPARDVSAATPTRSPNATPRNTDQGRFVAVAMRSIAFVCFSPRWGTERIEVSTPAARASARSAPTVARSRGRRDNGSKPK